MKSYTRKDKDTGEIRYGHPQGYQTREIVGEPIQIWDNRDSKRQMFCKQGTVAVMADYKDSQFSGTQVRADAKVLARQIVKLLNAALP